MFPMPVREVQQGMFGKNKATMCACGSLTIKDFQQNSRLIRVSSTSIVEGGAHDVITKESERRP